MKIKANYKPHPVKRYCGNPFLEALVFEQDAKKVSQLACIKPNVESNFWLLDEIYQTAILQELSDVHVPHPFFVSIYRKICALLINSYINRNPFSADANKMQHSMGMALHSKESFETTIERTTAPSLICHGISGGGKTTTIRKVFLCIPQVIEHSKYRGQYFRASQLTWLSIDVPATPSIKAMALNFFAAMDKALGTDYYNEWEKHHRKSVDQHLNAMRLAAERHSLGVVHIDEVQFLLKHLKSKDSPSLAIIEALFNKIGIPVILSCTTEGLELFTPNATDSASSTPSITTTRRMLSDQEFKFDLVGLDDIYFKELTNALFPENLWLPEGKVNEEFKAIFHACSCGLPAVMTRLAKLHHEMVVQLMNKKSGVTKQLYSGEGQITLLKSVYKNQFSLIDPALQLLRRGQREAYEKVIVGDYGKKAAFSNQEQKQQRRKSAKIPKIIKDEIGSSIVDLGLIDNGGGDIKVGIKGS